jgi:hypothetical protein
MEFPKLSLLTLSLFMARHYVWGDIVFSYQIIIKLYYYNHYTLLHIAFTFYFYYLYITYVFAHILIRLLNF